MIRKKETDCNIVKNVSKREKIVIKLLPGNDQKILDNTNPEKCQVTFITHPARSIQIATVKSNKIIMTLLIPEDYFQNVDKGLVKEQNLWIG